MRAKTFEINLREFISRVIITRALIIRVYYTASVFDKRGILEVTKL